MRKAFHEELAEVEALCVAVSGRITEQLERVMKALESFDEELADQVIAGDDAIDRVYMDVRHRIFRLLATQAPVASDLRLVSALLHINIHLERMGDLCTTIGKVVKLAKDLPRSEGIIRQLIEMGSQAGRMIDASMKALSQRDLNLALNLPRMDESISRLNRGMIKEVRALATEDEAVMEWAARMVLVSRQLERMGDHAVDIGEEVAFLVTGEFREFTDASHKPDLQPGP